VDQRAAERLAVEPLVLLMLAAGGPERMRLSDSWPLHRVLAEQASGASARPWLPRLGHRPDPVLTRRVSGVDEAVLALAESGALVPDGSGWRPSRPAMASARRHLRAMDDDVRADLYRLARAWRELDRAQAERRGRVLHPAGGPA
jgi:hypothetical protein